MSDLWEHYKKCLTDGEVRLARAVIERAILDGMAKRDSYDRRTARNFLTGCNPIWMESLEQWTTMAGIDISAILHKYRGMWGKNGTK